MDRRYCGYTMINIRIRDYLTRPSEYDCSFYDLRAGGVLARVTVVGAPADQDTPSDAPEVLDHVAHAAVSFALDGPGLDESLLEDSATGWVIRRRRPISRGDRS